MFTRGTEREASESTALAEAWISGKKIVIFRKCQSCHLILLEHKQYLLRAKWGVGRGRQIRQAQIMK